MDRRPRIAWAIPTMRVGGTEMQLLHLLKGLAHDFETTLICTRSEGALIGDARRAGAYVRVLDSPSGWDFRVERRMRRILAAHTPDILHTFLSGFDLFANRAARAAGVPVIVSSRRELATWQKPRHRFLQRRANHYVDCIVANSEAVAGYAAEQEGLTRARFRVIHNGVDADQFISTVPRHQSTDRFRLPPDTLNVGMVANFSPVKDHRLFLDMADRLLAQRQDLHFVLVGTGREVNAIGNLIRRRGQERFFTRAGTVSEVADLLHVMDVVVLTSSIEGFPNAIMEAMAAGKPCVTARVGGLPELITDKRTGLLLDERTPEAFARAVGLLLENAALRQTLGAAAGAWVRENLPVDRMVDAHRALYHELLRPAPRRGD